MDMLIRDLQQKQEVPSLFLHACCAPCSSYVLEYLSAFFRITVFYYNPNIFPEEEYVHRTKELERLIREMPVQHPVTFMEGAYDPERYFAEVKGLENEPEGGKRCEVCFRTRLFEAAKTASEHHFDYFATTLTISPLKNADLLNQIGEEA